MVDGPAQEANTFNSTSGDMPSAAVSPLSFTPPPSLASLSLSLFPLPLSLSLSALSLCRPAFSCKSTSLGFVICFRVSRSSGACLLDFYRRTQELNNTPKPATFPDPTHPPPPGLVGLCRCVVRCGGRVPLEQSSRGVVSRRWRSAWCRVACWTS